MIENGFCLKLTLVKVATGLLVRCPGPGPELGNKRSPSIMPSRKYPSGVCFGTIGSGDFKGSGHVFDPYHNNTMEWAMVNEEPTRTSCSDVDRFEGTVPPRFHPVLFLEVSLKST